MLTGHLFSGYQNFSKRFLVIALCYTSCPWDKHDVSLPLQLGSAVLFVLQISVQSRRRKPFTPNILIWPIRHRSYVISYLSSTSTSYRAYFQHEDLTFCWLLRSFCSSGVLWRYGGSRKTGGECLVVSGWKALSRGVDGFCDFNLYWKKTKCWIIWFPDSLPPALSKSFLWSLKVWLLIVFPALLPGILVTICAY